MKEPRLLTNLRGYALICGSGGVAALQAMKWELFSFPDPVRLWMVWFFSIVTIFSVFLGGFELLNRINEGIDDLRRLKEIKRKEEIKNEKQHETHK